MEFFVFFSLLLTVGWFAGASSADPILDLESEQIGCRLYFTYLADRGDYNGDMQLYADFSSNVSNWRHSVRNRMEHIINTVPGQQGVMSFYATDGSGNIIAGPLTFPFECPGTPPVRPSQPPPGSTPPVSGYKVEVEFEWVVPIETLPVICHSVADGQTIELMDGMYCVGEPEQIALYVLKQDPANPDNLAPSDWALEVYRYNRYGLAQESITVCFWDGTQTVQDTTDPDLYNVVVADEAGQTACAAHIAERRQ